MAWRSRRYFPYFPFSEPGSLAGVRAGINERCFIRKEHDCGKMYGASKSCFIACPSDDELEPILALISEKLTKLGIEPVIAIKERVYGQDIFCTKICGRIIESRFCLVILNDSVKNSHQVPNPNVYYEYGLMTALGKHVIPLQKESQKLAFNIQSHDTIKYNSRNLDSELERGIRDAVRISGAKEREKIATGLVEKNFLRKMEMTGFEEKGEKWFLNEAIEDTAFKGFGHAEKGFYVYLGKIDSESDIQNYLDDLTIVVYRTEKKIANIGKKVAEMIKRQKTLIKAEKTATISASGAVLSRPDIPSRGRYSIEREIEEQKELIRLSKTLYVGFITLTDKNMTEFLESANSKVKSHPRFKIVCTQDWKIQFGDITVDFGETRQ